VTSRAAARCWLLAAICLGARLPAQAPADRTALTRLRDSLSFAHDTTAILQHERVLIERARAERDDPMHHLRLGLIALRLSELRPGMPHLDDALGEFEWAAELRPEWPWPWYGIGLAESRGTDRAAGFAGGLYTMLGLDRDRLAGSAFVRALQVDPTFVGGLLEFARIALTQRIDAPVQPALEALRRATATPIGWDPALLLARGRLERLGGDPDSAVAAFRRAQLLSRDDGLAWLELARTIPLTGAIGGDSGRRLRERTWQAYLIGARHADRTVLAGYRRDLEPITDPRTLERFDDLTDSARIPWLERFWSDRDALELREPGARLAEHYRRWNQAVQAFRLPPFRRRYRWGIELYQSGDSEFDDRGVVLLRHGEPTLRIEWPKTRPAIRTNALTRSYGSESWRYDRPEGTMTLHFIAREDPQDYRLVESPTELDVAGDELAARAHELPGLARMLRAGDASLGWVSDEVRRNGRASMAIATRSDSWERGYREVLSGRAQWLAAGVRDGKPLVHIVYAVDAEAVRALGLLDDTPLVGARVRAAFFDRNGRAVATLDTLQYLRVPSEQARLVAARAEVPVAPGALRVRVGIELAPDVGVIFPVDSLEAPRPDAPRLQVSAVLLGEAGQSLPWSVTPADTAWLDAGGVYAPGDTLTVYAEAYGARPGETATFTVELTRRRSGLARLLGGRRTAVALTETLPITGAVTPFRRTLALGALDPGDYALEVTVTSGGRTIERRRGVVIR
jgi:tetratricopeptide (TPR) repeat protein